MKIINDMPSITKDLIEKLENYNERNNLEHYISPCSSLLEREGKEASKDFFNFLNEILEKNENRHNADIRNTGEI